MLLLAKKVRALALRLALFTNDRWNDAFPTKRRLKTLLDKGLIDRLLLN